MYLFSFFSLFFFLSVSHIACMLLAMVLPFWLLFLLQSYRVSVSVECTLAYKHTSLAYPDEMAGIYSD